MRRIVAALAALLCVSASAQAEVLVSISKSQQRLAVTVDGTEAYRWPVSTGRAGYQTPAGKFRPVRLERSWYSRKYDMAPMPYSVFFYRGYAVHGTIETANLGRPASHGCVRLSPDNASVLFSLVRRHGIGHTRLVVTDGPLARPPRMPSGVPMADAKPAPAEKPVPKTTRAGEQEHLSAKTQAASHVPPIPRRDVAQREEQRVAPRLRTRVASVAASSYSESSNEAQILREREAWLRGIDRKYGITR
jgi:L,D-transpeptidase catalytic domain